ncbi:dephospho-CoA kinase [Cochlodiniinecator piscidefendens]|uniref:dephospho-CoA kinase n=1 Tax=Cochlodiniinecator piscidefendens TaxID=2715756 RepID=UPI00140BD1D7
MTQPFVIGLTGSIGMGKSTTAAMFRECGVPVWDADAAVHRMYSVGGSAVAGIAAIYPDAVIDDAVSRYALKSWISADKTALKQIESVVHPLLVADRSEFLNNSASDIVVLDMPLLFEMNLDSLVNHIVVVSAPADVQRARVLERGSMTEDQFEMILAKQLPDGEKRKRADDVIETISLEAAKASVVRILADIQKGLKNA